MYRWRVYLFIQRFQQNPVIIHVNHCLLYLEMKPISFYQWVILKDIQKDIYVIEPKQKPNYIIWDWCPNTLTKGENFFFTIFWIFYIGYRAPSSIIFLIDFFYTFGTFYTLVHLRLVYWVGHMFLRKYISNHIFAIRFSSKDQTKSTFHWYIKWPEKYIFRQW